MKVLRMYKSVEKKSFPHHKRQWPNMAQLVEEGMHGGWLNCHRGLPAQRVRRPRSLTNGKLSVTDGPLHRVERAVSEASHPPRELKGRRFSWPRISPGSTEKVNVSFTIYET